MQSLLGINLETMAPSATDLAVKEFLPQPKKEVIPMKDRNKALKEHNLQLQKDSIMLVQKLNKEANDRKIKLREREERLLAKSYE